VATAAALGTLIAALVVNEKIKKARIARADRAPQPQARSSPITVALNQPHHPHAGGAAS